MTDTALVFSSAFVTVFCLGLQSLNVNQGQYIAAIVTSLFISTGSMYLYEYMAVPAWPAKLAFYVGAASGIAFSIWFHKRARVWLVNARARYWQRRYARIFKRKYGSADEHASVEHCGDLPRRMGGDHPPKPNPRFP